MNESEIENRFCKYTKALLGWYNQDSKWLQNEEGFMETRKSISLNEGWKTWLGDDKKAKETAFDDSAWKLVRVPHNWEDYQGYRRKSHGNLHGTAWYRKQLEPAAPEKGVHTFVAFGGAGSYADVYLNGVHLGRHEGGQTGFCLEMTDQLKEGANLLAVRTDHPEKIMDLPWVCGGCFGTPNTEGTQPFGINRSVSVYTTGQVRIRPYGVWILPQQVKEGHPIVRIRTEIENLEQEPVKIRLQSVIKTPSGETVEVLETEAVLKAGETQTVEQSSREIMGYQLWSLETPVLYSVESTVYAEGSVSDQVENTFGLRFIEWENFKGSAAVSVDEKKALEEPSEENEYFSVKLKSGHGQKVQIVPGGVKIWLPEHKPEKILIRLETTLENRDTIPHSVTLESFVQTYNATKSIANLKTEVSLEPGEVKTVVQETEEFHFLDQWTPENPVLHGTYSTIRETEDSLAEYQQNYTSFGIWDTEGLANRGYAFVENGNEAGKKHRFLLNGKHVFLNGTAEYQHRLGSDHAFEPEQIQTRMEQIQAAGFNAFREAHCPHDLHYIDYCDRHGILYWAQMGAHLYFDNEKFHENFKKLTAEFVRERRNSPSLMLWGIQNESLLPTVFATEISNLIRSMDDTASKERLITTCNGGSGSDWNVPQNWCGTYGGSVLDYQESFQKQLMAGEYGQYRVLGKHEEGDCEPRQNAGGDVSEELFCYCLETKVRLAEEIREKVYGHYQWIFNAHANPGREEIFSLDGSGLDGIGVVNSKGLLTSWGEPVDCFYMYRANYAPKETEPMVYIVSHTWPDRFQKTGEKKDITVYSNCDEVELFEGWSHSLGRQAKKGKKGEHYTFENCAVTENVLTAVGYVDGKPVAGDQILLKNLPESEELKEFQEAQPDILAGEEGEVLYRINCGSEQAYTDTHGNVWEADWTEEGTPSGDWSWKSWAQEYTSEGLDPRFGSWRTCTEIIAGTKDPELFAGYRYGREKLSYTFQVPDGKYRLNLYFMEPWYGVGGGMDCTGWRLFDVSVNGKTVLENVDIWKEAGVHKAWKVTVPAEAVDGKLVLAFPHVASGQAVISAIEVCR